MVLLVIAVACELGGSKQYQRGDIHVCSHRLQRCLVLGGGLLILA